MKKLTQLVALMLVLILTAPAVWADVPCVQSFAFVAAVM